MALSKQAKILTKTQINTVSSYLLTRRYGLRDQTIFLLSVRAGLRAKEIANLRWSMVTDADGNVANAMHLTDAASKGRSGRIVPLNTQLKKNLVDMLISAKNVRNFSYQMDHVITTERAKNTTAQTIVNMFQRWYDDIGLLGCSSHSGRRTFITNAAKTISTVGGSLRDVQMLAGHSSLTVTQRYIDADSEAQKRLIALL
jgi:integrase